MDLSKFEDIVSILKNSNRDDLINELNEIKSKIVDEDYKPTKREIKNFKRKEPYEYDDGSAEEEDLKYSVDDDGFYKLEFSDDENI